MTEQRIELLCEGPNAGFMQYRAVASPTSAAVFETPMGSPASGYRRLQERLKCCVHVYRCVMLRANNAVDLLGPRSYYTIVTTASGLDPVMSSMIICME